MRLAVFIELQRDAILAEAMQFGRTLAPLNEADEALVRDHLPSMLQNIADDLRLAQGRLASIAKSRGQAAAAHVLTDADKHGEQRALAGLTIDQLVAEYRALRSSVLRLWAEAHDPGPDGIRDLGRFNEAIDQAIAESVRAYAAETERRRQYFIAALGHDLRSPLQAVSLAVEALSLTATQPIRPFINAMRNGTQRMASLLNSLLDYNVVGLGGRMKLDRHQVDLKRACEEEVEIVRAALPEVVIELIMRGSCKGRFDASRIREALTNLVTNAAKHGAAAGPVIVVVEGSGGTVEITVTNAIDQPIPSAELPRLFEPTRRRVGKSQSADRASLGLGLFITKEIATSHGGDANAVCHGNTISFSIQVPKQEPGDV